MNQAKSSSTSSSDTNKGIKNRRLGAFFSGLALPVLLLGGYFAFSSILLHRSGEYLSLPDIVRLQSEKNSLYGSALHQRTFYYKQEIFKNIKPAIVALGSSRVLQFRQEDFSRPFVNLGSMSDLEETIEIAKTVFSEHRPETVILGLDFWWFHPSAEQRRPNRSPAEVRTSVNHMLLPLQWLSTGKASADDIRTLWSKKSPHIGISAIIRGDGFDKAGAYHYTSTLMGAAPPDDPAFRITLEKIKQGEKAYAHGNSLSQSQWIKLQKFLDDLAALNIKVILFFPPLAPQVAQAMSEKDYAYLKELRWITAGMAKARGLSFSDFHEAQTLGASDCEFIDGNHGGPVVYQRILLNFAVSFPETQSFIRLAETGWNIQNFGGQASLQKNEVDFLGLGCNKK